MDKLAVKKNIRKYINEKGKRIESMALGRIDIIFADVIDLLCAGAKKKTITYNDLMDLHEELSIVVKVIEKLKKDLAEWNINFEELDNEKKVKFMLKELIEVFGGEENEDKN